MPSGSEELQVGNQRPSPIVEAILLSAELVLMMGNSISLQCEINMKPLGCCCIGLVSQAE
jgi:hypothetical protein